MAAAGASVIINHQPLSALPAITQAVSLRSWHTVWDLNVHHCVDNDLDNKSVAISGKIIGVKNWLKKREMRLLKKMLIFIFFLM